MTPKLFSIVIMNLIANLPCFIINQRTADLIACVASLIDALACLTFLFLQANPTNAGRLYIAALIDHTTEPSGVLILFDDEPKMKIKTAGPATIRRAVK